MKHTIGDLYQMQSLPLRSKIAMTKRRIQDWYEAYDGMVYVSFSGGKDSTVLVDIIDDMRLDIPLVFCDTGLEYPEIRKFVKGYGDRVTWLKPKMSFRQVVEKYGFPMISKEVSECVHGARVYLKTILEEQSENITTDKQIPYAQFYRKICGTGEYSKFDKDSMMGSVIESEELANILNERMKNREGGANQRLAQMLGWLTRDTDNPIRIDAPSCDRSAYSLEKYKFLLEAPFEISNKCCTVMKKEPSHRYAKETGRKPITAQMASESRLRTQKWLQNGCNGYDLKMPISNPMSFWVNDDVLLYIKEKNLPICSVYGDIVEDLSGTDEVEGQMTISDLEGFEDMGIFDAKRPPLKTTGCFRTGCVLCAFGCLREKESRFLRLKETHPKVYKALDVLENNGVTYREAIEYINEHVKECEQILL